MLTFNISCSELMVLVLLDFDVRVKLSNAKFWSVVRRDLRCANMFLFWKDSYFISRITLKFYMRLVPYKTLMIQAHIKWCNIVAWNVW